MIRCIAMDDEPLALQQLSAYIRKVPYLELAAECHDAYDAMRVLGSEEIDAVFADINMPDLSGLDFIRSLSRPPLVVFTTAYSEYAIEGYKVSAIDYLLKPFSFDDFLAAADKVRRQYELVSANAASKEQKAAPEYLYIKADYKQTRINTADIRYVEGMSEYVRIYLEGREKPLTTLLSMRRIEETLPQDTFLRVHKSYIVNMAKAVSVCKTSVQMDADTFIPVGDSYRESLLKHIGERSFGK